MTCGGSWGGSTKGAPGLGTASQASPPARTTATTVSSAVSLVVIVVGAVRVEYAERLVPTYVSFQVDAPLVLATTVVAVWLTSNPQWLLAPVPDAQAAEMACRGSSVLEPPGMPSTGIDINASKDNALKTYLAIIVHKLGSGSKWDLVVLQGPAH